MFVLFFWPRGRRYFLCILFLEFFFPHSREYAGCSPVQFMQLKAFLHSNSVRFEFRHFAHIGGLVHLSLGYPYFWYFGHLRRFAM